MLVQMGQSSRIPVPVQRGDFVSSVYTRAVQLGLIESIPFIRVESWKLLEHKSDDAVVMPRMEDLLPWHSDSVLQFTMSAAASAASARQQTLSSPRPSYCAMCHPALTSSSCPVICVPLSKLNSALSGTPSGATIESSRKPISRLRVVVWQTS